MLVVKLITDSEGHTMTDLTARQVLECYDSGVPVYFRDISSDDEGETYRRSDLLIVVTYHPEITGELPMPAFWEFTTTSGSFSAADLDAHLIIGG